jgi:hypothetical protein
MPWWSKQHSDATIERSIAAFPSTMAADVRAALQVLPRALHEPTADDSIEVWISGERLRIPYRVYFVQPDTAGLEMLSPNQRQVLAALLTRHHDGHIRQRWVMEVLPSPEPWVPSFVVPLLGEYVVEIARTVQQGVSQRHEA